jgi:hypothetical protein
MVVGGRWSVVSGRFWSLHRPPTTFHRFWVSHSDMYDSPEEGLSAECRGLSKEIPILSAQHSALSPSSLFQRVALRHERLLSILPPEKLPVKHSR